MPGTRAHTHALRAVPVTSFLGDSAQLESHTSESPREQAAAGERGESEEEREPLGRQEVHQASGCRHRFGLAAEGGGGEGSDFLALGWLLGVGRSDYRGSGTRPAGMGIMRCLPKYRNPLEHRESYTIPAWNGAHGLSLPGESSLDLSLWPCGWVAGPTGPGGSEDPHQASRLSSTDSEPQTPGLASPRPVSSRGALHHWALLFCPPLAPALPSEEGRLGQNGGKCQSGLSKTLQLQRRRTGTFSDHQR